MRLCWRGGSLHSDRMISDSGGTTRWPQAPRFTNLTTTQSLGSSSPLILLANVVYYAQLFFANVLFSTHEGYLSSLN